MSELYNLKVELRTETGKSAARKLRRNGYVPGIYYDSQGTTVPVKVRSGPFYKAWVEAGATNVVELEYTYNGETHKKPCLIWDVDRHPFKKVYMHVDCYGVDLSKEVTVSVPVETQGTPKGTEDGGILELYRDHLDLTCLPANIPSQVVINVSKLKIGDSITLDQIKLPAGAKANYEESFAIVGLSPPRGEEPAAREEGEEESEEAAEQEESE